MSYRRKVLDARWDFLTFVICDFYVMYNFYLKFNFLLVILTKVVQNGWTVPDSECRNIQGNIR